jgi:hypothetical protein
MVPQLRHRRLVHKSVALAWRRRPFPAGLRLQQPRPTGAFYEQASTLFPANYPTSLLLNLSAQLSRQHAGCQGRRGAQRVRPKLSFVVFNAGFPLEPELTPVLPVQQST